MQIETKQIPDFQPVVITMTFHSQAEIEVFGAMCNVALCDILRHNKSVESYKGTLVEVQNRVFNAMQKYAKCIQIG